MTTPPDLKCATDDVVKKCGGPTRVQSTVAPGRAYASHVSDYANRNSDKYMPLDIAERCEADANDPFITRAVAARRGCILVQAFEPGLVSVDLDNSVTDITQAFAHLLVRVNNAKRDGKLSARERDDIHRDAMTLVNQVLEMDHEVATAPAGTISLLRRGA